MHGQQWHLACSLRCMALRSATLLLVLWGPWAALGCASTVREAAKGAAPGAVQGTVQAAQNPATRAGLAEALTDPRLRAAGTELSRAVTDGVLNAVADRLREGRTLEASDVFVEHMSHTLALSLRRDLGPALSDVAARSMERGLDAQTEARLRALADAVARGALDGLVDESQSRIGRAAPALDGAMQQMARDVARGAALGMQDAVAESTSREKAGKAPPGAVLAAAGVSSDSLLVALRGVGWLLVLAGAFVALAAIAWAVRHVRHAWRA